MKCIKMDQSVKYWNKEVRCELINVVLGNLINKENR